ncbi:uncharacterized protein BXZ73DRAFT_80900 [Epithele typhae]|uniref:uncharacterized protein n=1 Tax=Epithele typhae TaxID=378194 RepID=UPI002008E796|nr:uncharacterized protein BXZ73DRAFT_80900 [Epithele typhae]KAH9917143.1 hypothetical protein BXZ73DRAFT_80900 [Epithele typhae]
MSGLADAAPQLRSLSLNVRAACDDFHSMLPLPQTELPAALPPLPLVHPTVTVRRVEKWGEQPQYMSYCARLGAPRPRTRTPCEWLVDAEAATEVSRVHTLHALPRLLVDAIPTLRVLAAGPYMPTVQVEDDGVPEDRQEAVEMIKKMRAAATREMRWGSLTGRGGAGGWSKWKEDGERARDVVDDEGFDGETGLNGKSCLKHIEVNQSDSAALLKRSSPSDIGTTRNDPLLNRPVPRMEV